MMSEKTERAAILGMGALGMLYGSMIQKNLGQGAVDFLMDKERVERHKGSTNRVNGEKMIFSLQDASSASPYDLVIVAVKYGALRTAMQELVKAVGPDTVIISVMNGIDSEEILAEQYDREHIIDCVAIGMDAMRDGNTLKYTRAGRLQIGSLNEGQKPFVRRLADFFDRAGVPYEVCPDIQRAMWNKYMLNVGINQACTVYATDYAHATSEPILSEMEQAMREVITVAAAEGVHLTEKDLSNNIAIEKTLDPAGYPSMRQDIVAGRKTEVDMFSGILIRLADKHGIDVPVNRKYNRKIKEIEQKL